MECLHRFCGDCIQKCLRMGMKECPSCRVHIPSRRSLRPDTTYDTIMEVMYGDIESLEAREADEIARFNRMNNMNNSYSQSRHLKKLQQANQRKKGMKPPAITTSPTPESNNNVTASDMINESQTGTATDNHDQNSTTAYATINASGSATHPRNPQQYAKLHNLKESKLIEFILRKDPRENSVSRLHRECIKVSSEMTIRHLKRFLGKKLAHAPWTDFQITVNAGWRQVILDDSIQLKQVRGEICDFFEGVMMMLQYFIQSLPPVQVQVPAIAFTTNENSEVENIGNCEIINGDNGQNDNESQTEAI